MAVHSARAGRPGRVWLTVSLAFGLACGPGEAPRRTSFDPGPTPPEYAEGEMLFTATCAPCHGLMALGTEQGPPLVHIIYEPGHHSDEAFYRAVSLGVQAHHWRFGNMPAQPGVDRASVSRIIGYVRWLQRSAGIE